MDKDEMVEELVAAMSATELRKWMRGHGISRSRGASKKQSARRAVESKPDVVEEYLGLNEPTASVHCMCGYEEYCETEREAVKLAKEHSIKKASCNAKAWSSRGPMLYGTHGR